MVAMCVAMDVAMGHSWGSFFI